jgi:hypothetical protein
LCARRDEIKAGSVTKELTFDSKYAYGFIASACWVESTELDIERVSAQRLQRLTESGEQADLAKNKNTPGALTGPGWYGEG